MSQVLREITFFNHPENLSIEKIETFLSKLTLNEEDVKNHLTDPDHLAYGRNTLLINEHVEVCLIHWVKGSESDLHDHADSDCSMLVVEGELLNDNYLWEQGTLKKSFSDINKENDVVTISKDDIHQIKPLGGKRAISFHVYYPPIENNNIF